MIASAAAYTCYWAPTRRAQVMTRTPTRSATRVPQYSRLEDRTAELIATLREQLQAERQAHAEARRLLAAALERIPAIEAPQEASETSETVEEEPERAEPNSATGGDQEGARRPWWRRWFGARDS
jgi:hypothetical protein